MRYAFKRFNRPTYTLSIALLGLSLLACVGKQADARDSASNKSHDAPEQAHWGYMGVEGPEHWAMLTDAYQTCEAGNLQSPINIDIVQAVQGQDHLEFRYAPARIFEVNNGHTIQVSHETGCELGLRDQAFKLRQFHFHAPSEHHLHGKTFPMELHLVHQDAQGQVVVVAVLMETGAESPVLTSLWDWLPNQMGKEVSLPLEMNIATILPPDPHYFSYRGSLTTPPCTEGVRWIVLTEPVRVAEEDVQRFAEIIGPNARPVQPLRGRKVYEN